MTRFEYREKSATAEGRKNLHTEMLSEIKHRMDTFANNAPESNKEKVSALINMVFGELEEEGNSILFDFFASDQVTDKDFLKHVQEIVRDVKARR